MVPKSSNLTIADVEDALLTAQEEHYAILEGVLIEFYLPLLEQVQAQEAAGRVPPGSVERMLQGLVVLQMQGSPTPNFGPPVGQGV